MSFRSWSCACTADSNTKVKQIVRCQRTLLRLTKRRRACKVNFRRSDHTKGLIAPGEVDPKVLNDPARYEVWPNLPVPLRARAEYRKQ